MRRLSTAMTKREFLSLDLAGPPKPAEPVEADKPEKKPKKKS